MKRMQLVELEDLPWFPGILRDGGTAYLGLAVRHSGHAKLLVPPLERTLAATGATRLVDLCSGAGGPVRIVADELAARGRPVTALLTDRYPNLHAFEHASAGTNGRVAGRAEPVDATNVPADLVGFRTIFNAFHGDGDGFGDGDWRASSCDAAGSWVAQDGDCDDADAATHPGADERCNGLDDDCDGDAEVAELRYEDADGDGFGVDGTEALECTGAGSPVGGDCDDADVETNPSAAEVAGDGVDNDCDGVDAEWGPFEGTASESATTVTGMGGYAMDAGRDGVVIQDSDAVLRFPLSARGALEETDAIAQFGRLDDASSFGADLLYVPDQDGDGVEDILIGSVQYGRVGIPSAAYLVSGAATGTQDPNDGIGSVEAIDDEQAVGTSVRWLGGDLLIAVSDSRVDMRLFKAPMVGVRTTGQADAVITGDGIDPYDAATPGDMDGDGIDDVVYAGYIDQATLVAWVVRGPQETMSLLDADARWEGSQDANAAVLAGVGDLTGDGAPDVLIGGRPAVWMPADPFGGGDLGASGPEILGFGTDFSAGDLNGDGALDLVAGSAPEGDGGRGLVAGFLGPLGGGSLTHEDAELRIWGDQAGNYLGYHAASGFDADGDGFDDTWFSAAQAGTSYLALSSAWPDGV